MNKGLTLFQPETPPVVRRRRIAVVLLVVTATVALIWPIYDAFGGTFPLVFGLPFSMAWVVFWLFVVFGALVWLYRTET